MKILMKMILMLAVVVGFTSCGEDKQKLTTSAIMTSKQVYLAAYEAKSTYGVK